MPQAVTLRLPDEDVEDIRRIAQRERRSVSEVTARIVDEWLRQSRFPQIEFRSINGERVACLKGRLEIWQVILVARRYEALEPAAEHLGLSPEQVQAALHYYQAYPQEIDFALEENAGGLARLKRLFPGIQAVGVTDDDLARVAGPEP